MRSKIALTLVLLTVVTVPSLARCQELTQCNPCASCACDCNCCDQSDCGFYCGCCDKDRLFGLLAPSDCRFTDFISPMTNPVYF